jgi:hypothetical protein
MKRIVLTEEQARLLSPTEIVQICDPRGNVITAIPPELTPEEFAKLRRAKDCKGPWVTGEQVHKTLVALEEAWQREGPFGRDRLQELLQEIRAARGG